MNSGRHYDGYHNLNPNMGKDVAVGMEETPIGWVMTPLGSLAGIMSVVDLTGPHSNLGIFALTIKDYFEYGGCTSE